MIARTALADLLVSMLPNDIRVLPYARDLDQPDQSTVMLRLDEVRPSTYGQGLNDYEFALLLVARQTASGSAEDELDSVLDDVIHALNTSDLGVTWKQAVPASFEQKYPTYEVTVTITTRKES